MLRLISDLSTVLSVVAGLVGCQVFVRPQSRLAWFRLVGLPYVFLAALMITVSLYLRSPFSPLRVRLLGAALCLAPAPWLLIALTLCEQSLRTVFARWRVLLVVLTASSMLAAGLMWTHGVDWITGIASEPAAVLTSWGLIAIAIGAIPGCAALGVFARRVSGDAATVPALWMSAVGTICSLMWIAGAVLWRGYLSVDVLQPAATLAGAAAALGVVGILQTTSAIHALAPSRRLVYGASAASLIAAYVIVARFALGWVVDLAAAAIPEILPVAIFIAAGGVLWILGSQRWRHRVWVTVGRQLFRGKHDYGEIWVALTKLVAAARDASDLAQQAAAFCRSILCVPEVSVWLGDSAGRLTRTALATVDRTPKENMPPPHRGAADSAWDAAPTVPAQDPGLGTQDSSTFARSIGAAFACSLSVDGRHLGFLAVGTSTQAVKLDEEDRRVVRYVAAELASTLALYRLGEEIADAREIESFHRVSAFILHDLKNLVAQQSFVLENAARFRNNPTFVTDALAAFEDSTNRMRSLIGRLRSSEPRVPLTRTPCDLLEVIREVIALPHVALRGRRSVQLMVAEGLQACPLMLERATLTQLFRNLLVNALESLQSESGLVVVQVTRVAGGWRAEVRDNGCGIPEPFLRHRLFRPLHTTKETGLGIGLYQCKTIVEAVGGTITVSSQQSVGTTVAVTLPAHELGGSHPAMTIGAQDGKTDSTRC